MTTSAQIVNILMNDHSSTNNIPSTGQCDRVVRKYYIAVSIRIAKNISQITNMPYLILRTGVLELVIQIKILSFRCLFLVIFKAFLRWTDYNERRD